MDRLKLAKSVNDIEGALIDAVRTVAARLPNAVGPDVMAVAFPNGGGPVRVRYLPAVAARVAYSPFVVSPGAVHQPSILAGTMSLHVGSFEIVFEAPERDGEPVSLSSQPRQPPP